MNDTDKQRPAPDSPLRKLKRLSMEERAEVYSWKSEELATNASIRTRIAKQFGIVLKLDKQLSEFWRWQFRQAPLDHLGEMMSQDEEQLRDKFPNLSRDQIRDAVIKRGYAIADMAGDVKLSLKVVATDLKDKSVGQEDRKLVLLERRAHQADEAEQVTKSELSAEEKAAEYRRIFGMG